MFQHFNMIANIINIFIFIIIIIIIIVPDIVSRHRSGCCLVTTHCSVVAIVATTTGIARTINAAQRLLSFPRPRIPVEMAKLGGGRPTAESSQSGRSISE